MQIVGTKVDIDRKLLAKQLANPLARLMAEEGDAISAAELRKVILDPATTIEFPDIEITQAVSRIRIRRRRVIRVRTISSPQIETNILEA